jgi:hypothetical protein
MSRTAGCCSKKMAAEVYFVGRLQKKLICRKPTRWLGTGWEKGERLAKLVAHRRTLLLLDGLEPLQNPPGPDEGRLREPFLQALLRELAAFNIGLCVITARTLVADLADHERTSAYADTPTRFCRRPAATIPVITSTPRITEPSIDSPKIQCAAKTAMNGKSSCTWLIFAMPPSARPL